MNILSAIYSGQAGFLKAKESMDVRAARIAQMGHEPGGDEGIAEDLVGMKIDGAVAKANLRVMKVADDLMGELIRANMDKK